MSYKKLRWGLLAGLLAATPFVSSAAVMSHSVSKDASLLGGLKSQPFTKEGGSCTDNGFAGCTADSSYAFVTGDLRNSRLRPGSNENAIPVWEGVYLNVPQPSAEGGLYSPTMQLGSTVKSYGMLWGSVDVYNEVHFLLDGAKIGGFTGTEVAKSFDPAIKANGSGNFHIDLYTLFHSESGFNQVKFISEGSSFETADHRYAAVPEPMALGLLALGLLGMGLMGRRRTSKSLQA